MAEVPAGLFLREVQCKDWPDAGAGFPYDLPALQGLGRVRLSGAVTFFVGENGSGKSTLLEGIAASAGFNAEGGSRSNVFSTTQVEASLENHLRLSWLPKATRGFFLRAESFFNFASYIDDVAREDGADVYDAYGGRSLHLQSHGESFLNLFTQRLRGKNPALYLLDEPEAALSPARQLALLRILFDHEQRGLSQFIIATHSPILLAYPGAKIFSFDTSPLSEVKYEDTEHYRVTRQFLESPDRFLRELFRAED